jgi:hypothetical protein
MTAQQSSYGEWLRDSRFPGGNASISSEQWRQFELPATPFGHGVTRRRVRDSPASKDAPLSKRRKVRHTTPSSPSKAVHALSEDPDQPYEASYEISSLAHHKKPIKSGPSAQRVSSQLEQQKRSPDGVRVSPASRPRASFSASLTKCAAAPSKLASSQKRMVMDCAGIVSKPRSAQRKATTDTGRKRALSSNGSSSRLKPSALDVRADEEEDYDSWEITPATPMTRNIIRKLDKEQIGTHAALELFECEPDAFLAVPETPEEEIAGRLSVYVSAGPTSPSQSDPPVQRFHGTYSFPKALGRVGKRKQQADASPTRASQPLPERVLSPRSAPNSPQANLNRSRTEPPLGFVDHLKTYDPSNMRDSQVVRFGEGLDAVRARIDDVKRRRGL